MSSSFLRPHHFEIEDIGPENSLMAVSIRASAADWAAVAAVVDHFILCADGHLASYASVSEDEARVFVHRITATIAAGHACVRLQFRELRKLRLLVREYRAHAYGNLKSGHGAAIQQQDWERLCDGLDSVIQQIDAKEREMPFSVHVCDNFHHEDESNTNEFGRYPTIGLAVAACERIVEDYLVQVLKPGMSADDLLRNYRRFGEDPCIFTIDKKRWDFSACAYAEKRSQELVASLR